MKYDITKEAQLYKPLHNYMYSVLDGNYIYYTTSRAINMGITKIDIATFTEDSILTTSATDSASGIVAVGSYLYSVGDILVPDYARLSKIKIGTFTEDATLDLTQDADHTDASGMAESGGYLYVGLSGGIGKIRLSDFTENDFLNLGGRHDQDVAISNGYLYATDYTANPSVIHKVRLSDFTSFDSITLATGERYAEALHINGNYLYVGCNTAPGRIVRIDLATFTRVNAITLDDINGYYFRNTWALTSSGDILFVAHGSATGAYISLINLTSFIRISQVYRSGITADTNLNIIYYDEHVYTGQNESIWKLSLGKLIYGIQII